MSLLQRLRPCLLRLRARVHAPMLVSIALLFGFEVLVARSDWLWDYAPRSQGAMVTVAEDLMLASPQSPDVVILGTSRARDAVSPRALERYAGIPRGRAVNLGITGGTPFDALVLYRRNRAKLSHSRLLVLGLELWGFGVGRPTETDRRYATLRDRLLLFDRRHALQLVVGGLWRTWDAEPPLRRLLKIQWNSLLLGESSVRSQVAAPGLGPDGRLAFRTAREKDKTHEAINAVVELVCSTYAPGEGRFRQAQELIDLAASDGVPVLLVLFPTRTEFRDTLRSRYPAVYADFHREAPLLRGARLTIWETPQEAGLQEDSFDDYGHMTARGAALMAKELARVIRQWYPEVVTRNVPSSPGSPPHGR